MLYEIKSKLAEWRDSSTVGSKVFVAIRGILIQCMSVIPDEQYAKMFYKIYTKKKLNLENPQTINEKMWWLKLNNRNPLLTKCSDKHLARDYVKECGYDEILIPQLGVYKSADEINFSQFTESVIAKCNNNSGAYFFYSPNITTESEMKAGKKALNKRLKQKYWLVSREWNYKDIPPRIVVEKVIRDQDGNTPNDYRFFCFDGEPKILMRDIGVLDENGKYQHEYPRNLYDMNFELLPMKWGREPFKGKVEKPDNFEKMKEIARKLSEPFPMCRVDLYNVDGQIYFGEMTFYHGGCCQSIQPEEWEYKLGSWIDLKSPKVIRKEK